jgi:hypothetical protein
MRYREDVTVFSDSLEHGVVILGRGLAGRMEVSVEVSPERQGSGVGRRMFGAARNLVPHDEPLFAQVAPGNAASLRAILGAGFRPIGSEVLFPKGLTPLHLDRRPLIVVTGESAGLPSVLREELARWRPNLESPRDRRPRLTCAGMGRERPRSSPEWWRSSSPCS